MTDTIEKAARAKLDNEAYQRGYADGMKHSATGREAVALQDCPLCARAVLDTHPSPGAC